jgi:hypothetical protein
VTARATPVADDVTARLGRLAAIARVAARLLPVDTNPVPRMWTHLTKVDPEDRKRLPLLYPRYLRHTDAVVVPLDDTVRRRPRLDGTWVTRRQRDGLAPSPGALDRRSRPAVGATIDRVVRSIGTQFAAGDDVARCRARAALAVSGPGLTHDPLAAQLTPAAQSRAPRKDGDAA